MTAVTQRRKSWGDRWYVWRVWLRGPKTLIRMVQLRSVCDHPSAELLQSLALRKFTPTGHHLLNAAHAAALWAADLELMLTSEREGTWAKKKEWRSQLTVLAQSLHAVEVAAQAAVTAGPDDASAARELEVCLSRWILAWQPFLTEYAGSLARVYAHALAVDPVRAAGINPSGGQRSLPPTPEASAQ